MMLIGIIWELVSSFFSSAKMNCCLHSLSYDWLLFQTYSASMARKIYLRVDSVWGLLSGFMAEAKGMGVALHTSVKAVVLSPVIFYNSCRKWTSLMLIPRGEYIVLIGLALTFNGSSLMPTGCTWWYNQALFFALISNYLIQSCKI